MSPEILRPVTYEAIIAEAKSFANQQPKLPPLPSLHELQTYADMMDRTDELLIVEVIHHLKDVGWTPGHGYQDHLRPVALFAAYAADLECQHQKVNPELKTQIIQVTWRLGLVHDIERHLGYGIEHMTEGARVTQDILNKLGIQNLQLANMVAIHDQLEQIVPFGDPEIDIPLFSVFAEDHRRWGEECRIKRWQRLAVERVDPSYAIHDYGYMRKLLSGGNLKQTRFGRDVALPYIDQGLAMLQHIETTFSV